MFELDKETKKLIKLAIFSGKQKEAYPQLVEYLIRKRYTVAQELAIQRQRDTKQNDFVEYNTYCEECKNQAKVLLEF